MDCYVALKDLFLVAAFLAIVFLVVYHKRFGAIWENNYALVSPSSNYFLAHHERRGPHG